MVFNSISYLVFFPAVIAVYFATSSRFRWIVVLVASYYFYMSWRPAYGILLFAITFMSWLAGLLMHKISGFRKKKIFLAGTILATLAPLLFFKYFDFASISLWKFFPVDGTPFLLNLTLPLGISFYTFQSLAYVIDVYRRELKPERNLGRYATFVSFFPHLVAGPILRPANILPQLNEDKRWSGEDFKAGLFLVATGLIKKIVIADNLAHMVDRTYNSPLATDLSGGTLWAASIFFAFQLYCDFSGYTDIAIGSARILSYRIPDNFRQPFFSRSIAEFWQRWHISLSSWFHDYFYTPLALIFTRRIGKWGIYATLFLTFVVIGFWHGAGWNYIFMGALFGVYIVSGSLLQPVRRGVLEMAGKLGVAGQFLLRGWKIFATFNLVALTFMFFRINSSTKVLTIIREIFFDFGSFGQMAFSRIEIILSVLAILLLIGFDALETKKRLSNWLTCRPWYYHAALAYFTLLVLMIFGAQSGPRFIYFQF